ncbi:MAG: sigma-70 family RNA polymerase sigma factor [Flavobacteriales bacterium]|jgi:RNA polymerase sigma-70 factor (ECF subfamily)|nr:sigma-70 family RNA polymerase sigma factor [Flavobacteriales bacterium]
MNTDKLSEIFKVEYSNLVAVLYNFYGVNDIQLAEDIVSEAFMKAMKTWAHKGIPENPKAWLRKVAQNSLLDHYRRKAKFNESIAPKYKEQFEQFSEIKITEELIEDSQLNMIFVVCDPQLNREAQICLALRILCGFNIEEIAKALLSNKTTINKRLYRAKNELKNKIEFKRQLSEEEYKARMATVLRIIYLIFNEGYYSSVNERNIRYDMCWEAMRLAILLSRKKQFNQPEIEALIALMCFHSSRFEARIEGLNGDLLLNEQDQSKWNFELIEKGKTYLKKSVKESSVSKYHLEAVIAYWHTTESQNKWEHILNLYNQLLVIDYSPIIAMNRVYAVAMAIAVDEALIEAQKLDLTDHSHYYCLLAELHRLKENSSEEINYLSKALALSTKKSEQVLIKNKLAIASSRLDE